MQETVKTVNAKLNEYGIIILKEHDGEEDQHIIFCEDMVVFIYPDKTISISFQATAKPDNVAQNILILKEIPDLDIAIMESFIYRKDNRLIIGDEAYDIIKDSISEQAISKHMLEQSYKYLLDNVDNASWHKC